MDKIIIKNNFAVSAKKVKHDINGCPRYEINIYAKYGNMEEEYNNINFFCYNKGKKIGKYSKAKNVFTLISYDINKKISEILSEIENIFEEV